MLRGARVGKRMHLRAAKFQAYFGFGQSEGYLRVGLSLQGKAREFLIAYRAVPRAARAAGAICLPVKVVSGLILCFALGCGRSVQVRRSFPR